MTETEKNTRFMKEWNARASRLASKRRLEKAAPDLLEACKLIASCAGQDSFSFYTARMAARAAIAKATP